MSSRRVAARLALVARGIDVAVPFVYSYVLRSGATVQRGDALIAPSTTNHTRVADLPFAPVVAWPMGGGLWSGIGLGDLLMAAVCPLVMRKGFGRAAGVWTMAIVIAALTIVLALPIQSDFPVMVVLGPLMVLQYVCWRRARAGAHDIRVSASGTRPVRKSRDALGTIE
jgi:hypothetical protein